MNVPPQRSTKLPEPIGAYFAASNQHDIDAALAPVRATTIVTDEGRERSGLAAIREWIEETTRKYRPTTMITAIAEKPATRSSRLAVRHLESPLDVRYSLTLNDNKIVRLEIH